MIRIFLDASAIFSAAHSGTGASRELFVLANQGQIELVTNAFVIDEIERNLAQKQPDAIIVFRALLRSNLATVYKYPAKEDVLLAASYTAIKDAPVVAGAISSRSHYLATFDRKHLINPAVVAQNAGIIIATPGDILNQMRTMAFRL